MYLFSCMTHINVIRDRLTSELQDWKQCMIVNMNQWLHIISTKAYQIVQWNEILLRHLSDNCHPCRTCRVSGIWNKKRSQFFFGGGVFLTAFIMHLAKFWEAQGYTTKRARILVLWTLLRVEGAHTVEVISEIAPQKMKIVSCMRCIYMH